MGEEEESDLREATASELLTLEEEYENQTSWRTARDKLTFIVCLPLPLPLTSTSTSSPSSPSTTAVVHAGEADTPDRMVGDINLFLTPSDSDPNNDAIISSCDGEIDIMIASPQHRGRGLGEAAVRAFIRYLSLNQEKIMSEYSSSSSSPPFQSQEEIPSTTSDPEEKEGQGEGDQGAKIKRLVAKINADNEASIRLFETLGFAREGEPNYFNEVSMVLEDFASVALAREGREEIASGSPAEIGGKVDGEGETNGDAGYYRELHYDRSRLKHLN
ncbi:acetyltransferase domain-containing protein [Xylariaceae sp. FL0594]|nr:acetyltransferase domain-containing protein [Xylariaceae sp. FL0594]